MNLDSEIVLQTYDLADMINSSAEVMEYLKYKKEVQRDPRVIELKQKLAKEKIAYEDVQRFGHFHPDYKEAMNKIKKTLQEFDDLDIIKKYKKAEQTLDELLYSVGKILANSISGTIKVPKNDSLPDGDTCATGGCNTCGIQDSCSIRQS